MPRIQKQLFDTKAPFYSTKTLHTFLARTFWHLLRKTVSPQCKKSATNQGIDREGRYVLPESGPAIQNTVFDFASRMHTGVHAYHDEMPPKWQHASLSLSVSLDQAQAPYEEKGFGSCQHVTVESE